MDYTVVRKEEPKYEAFWFWCDCGYIGAMKKCVEWCEKEEREADHVTIESADEGGFYVTMYFPIYHWPDLE